MDKTNIALLATGAATATLTVAFKMKAKKNAKRREEALVKLLEDMVFNAAKEVKNVEVVSNP